MQELRNQLFRGSHQRDPMASAQLLRAVLRQGTEQLTSHALQSWASPSLQTLHLGATGGSSSSPHYCHTLDAPDLLECLASQIVAAACRKRRIVGPAKAASWGTAARPIPSRLPAGVPTRSLAAVTVLPFRMPSCCSNSTMEVPEQARARTAGVLPCRPIRPPHAPQAQQPSSSNWWAAPHLRAHATSRTGYPRSNKRQGTTRLPNVGSTNLPNQAVRATPVTHRSRVAMRSCMLSLLAIVKYQRRSHKDRIVKRRK